MRVQPVDADASESLDQSAARIGTGTIKAVCFGALREAGADGLDILALVQAVQVSSSFTLCQECRGGLGPHGPGPGAGCTGVACSHAQCCGGFKA